MLLRGGAWWLGLVTLIACDTAPPLGQRSAALANGATCSDGSECDSTICEDGVCCAVACGLCSSCDPSGTQCNVVPTDDVACPAIDCEALEPLYGGCRDFTANITTNRCFSAGVCKTSSNCTSYTKAPAGTKCGLCAVCNTLGLCFDMPADDAACPPLSCTIFDSACRTYLPVVTNRCAEVGACKVSAPADCANYVDQPDGTWCGLCAACGGGVCGGTPVADDPDCGTVDCDKLDSPCVDFTDRVGDRCLAPFACKPPNQLASCGPGVAKPVGTLCEQVLAQEGFESFAQSSGAWTVSASAAHSGMLGITDSPGGNYGNDVNLRFGWAPALPGGKLPASGKPVLKFWHRYDFEPVVDRGTVGVSWFPTGSPSPREDLVATFGADSPQTGWREETISLEAFVGHTVTLVFRVRSNSSVTADGWYLDDLRILADDSVCRGCDQAGSCTTGTAIDDPRCGTIDCDALDSMCLDYSDLTSARCLAVGACKPPNELTSCGASTPTSSPGCTPDLTTPPPADLAAPSDLEPPIDLGTALDLVAPSDLRAPADLAAPLDLRAPADLAASLDLFPLRDLSAPTDLTTPLDPPTDLATAEIDGAETTDQGSGSPSASDLASGQDTSSPLVDATATDLSSLGNPQGGCACQTTKGPSGEPLVLLSLLLFLRRRATSRSRHGTPRARAVQGDSDRRIEQDG